MLTKSDEQVIRKILKISLKDFVTKQDIDELKLELKAIKRDTRKIRNDLEMVTGEFDKELIEVKKRVVRLEGTPFPTLQ